MQPLKIATFILVAAFLMEMVVADNGIDISYEAEDNGSAGSGIVENEVTNPKACTCVLAWECPSASIDTR